MNGLHQLIFSKPNKTLVKINLLTIPDHGPDFDGGPEGGEHGGVDGGHSKPDGDGLEERTTTRPHLTFIELGQWNLTQTNSSKFIHK